MSTTAHGLYTGTGDPNSGLYACIVGSLPAEPSHQPEETLIYITSLDHLPLSLFESGSFLEPLTLSVVHKERDEATRHHLPYLHHKDCIASTQKLVVQLVNSS